VSRRRAGLLALLLLTSAACSSGPPLPAARTVEIGLDLPLSGPESVIAQAAADEVRLVVDSVYHGHVEGLPVRLTVLDDTFGGAADPALGQRNLRRLAAGSALGVIGPLDSSVAEAEIPIAGAAHLPLVSPAASNACLTRPLPDCDGLSTRLRPSGPTSFFRVVPTDDGEAAALVQFAFQQLRATHFAVGSDGQAYGVLLRDRFIAALKARGLTPVYAKDLDPSAADAVDGFLAAARTAGAEAVLFGGRPEGSACLVAAKTPAALGAGAAFLGGSALVGAACEKDAGAAATSIYAAEDGPGIEAGSAARVLLQAIASAVKSEGGNLPSREQVRLAISRSSSPAFDSRGDLKVRQYSIVQGQVPLAGGPPSSWLAAATATL
jgi:branched-chain amino acid transport system substrate-binding protein